MRNPFFTFFNTGRDAAERYLFNPTIERVKTYYGTDTISLPSAQLIDTSFSQAVTDRVSEADFSHTTMTLQLLSDILYWSAAELGEGRDGQGQHGLKMHRPHPSGGAKYPLELYLLIDGVDGLQAGLYHYRPDHHSLDLIVLTTETEMKQLKADFHYEYVQSAPVVVLFSFIMERGMPKYGSFAYKIGLIEAGHIGQNIYLACSARGVKCTALGGFAEERLHEQLALDGYNETLFYACVVGKDAV